MRVLLLTHSFNSLSQRLYVELAERGHELSVELDIHDEVTAEAVALFRPDAVVAPFLRRARAREVWEKTLCLVVHPGPPGDRGASSLDRAILRGEAEWGVTVLAANGEFDAGDVWAARRFSMRDASKSSLYRNEVTEAAVAAVIEALARVGDPSFRPLPQDPTAPLLPPLAQAERRIDWERDATATVLRKIRAGDGSPGVRDGSRYLYDAWEARDLGGRPGAPVARSPHGPVALATQDGAIWIGHMRAAGGLKLPAAGGLKLPAATVLGEAALDGIPEHGGADERDLRYEERGAVGWLWFPAYNGALSAAQCRRLRDAVEAAKRRPTRVLVLAGGPDFWCNGLHLHAIEAAESPADASLENIEAMDDLCLSILQCDDRWTIAAMAGNAAAGGVYLALTADHVAARHGIVLNPHYKNMGNLYGSEYWTYTLPRRVGAEAAADIMQRRLPMGVPQALRRGLVDAALAGTPSEFYEEVWRRALREAADPTLDARLAAKREERSRPLDPYRAAEIEAMKLNFYGFDPSYHVARYHFTHRVPHSWTPRHLAVHRALSLTPEPEAPRDDEASTWR